MNFSLGQLTIKGKKKKEGEKITRKLPSFICNNKVIIRSDLIGHSSLEDVLFTNETVI